MATYFVSAIDSNPKHALYREIRLLKLVKRMEKRSKRTRAVRLASSKKRLSSEDFLKKADKLWRAGPEVKYQHPDSW